MKSPLASRALLVEQARAAYRSGQYATAEELCHRVLRDHRDDVDALIIMHMLGRVRGNRAQAVTSGQKLIAAAPRRNIGYFLLSEDHISNGEYDKGMALLNRWLKKSPNDPEGIARLAEAHDMRGESETAASLLQPFVERGRETAPMALLLARRAIEGKDPARAITLLERHLNASTTDDETRKEMCFSMGLACERLGRTDDAFAWYTRGHQILPYRFDIDAYLEQIERTICTFTPERFARMPRARVPTRLPIFLVCRPRSGSTLAERILASHPQVRSAGELMSISKLADQLNLLIGSTRTYPECVLDIDQNDINQLAADFMQAHQTQFSGAPRITIKHLDLWKHIGLISMLLPQATIVDLRRNAVDTALACYSVHLGLRQPYNQNLRWLGQVHRAYERLMDHWRLTLNIPMLRLDYEDLVADQETKSRELIEYCGLEWSDQCLRFHESSAAGTTGATLSYQQVRLPIYKTSVGRAARFGRHLAPLYEGLGLPAPDDVQSST